MDYVIKEIKCENNVVSKLVITNVDDEVVYSYNDDLLEQQVLEMRLEILGDEAKTDKDSIFKLKLKQAKYVALDTLYPYHQEITELPDRIAKDWQVRCAIELYNAKDIRNDLILYRYNLIYMNMELENSFFNDMLSTEVSLEASKYRTAEVPSYIFVDKAILVLESLDYIAYIKSHDGEENPNSQSLIIISIINILTRLTLCEEETLSLIYDDLTDLLASEDLTFTTKKLINDMQDILKNMHFDWAR